jgi:hypothetical protein
MTLEKTIYPPKDGRRAIGACQWIQFQLDSYSTAEEVIRNDANLRIVDASSKFHFLVCDRSGRTAVIEFLDGKMVCHTGDNLPYPVLANSTYDESIRCFQKHGDTQSDRSLYNFTMAVQMACERGSSGGNLPVAYAFAILNAVSQGVNTKWSIVYDIHAMKFFIKVFETPTIVGERKIFLKRPGESKIKEADVKKFDFDCMKLSKVLDLEFDGEGTMNAQFVDYSTGINEKFIAKAFAFFKSWGIGIDLKDEEIRYLAKYPESFRCIEDR